MAVVSEKLHVLYKDFEKYKENEVVSIELRRTWNLIEELKLHLKMIIFDYKKRRLNMAHHTNMDLCRQLAWDYNIPADDLVAVIQGRKESAGHYTRSKIFKKIIESYSWFTVLQLFTPVQIHELLTDDLANSLRMPSLRKKYAFIRKRLQETLPVTG